MQYTILNIITANNEETDSKTNLIHLSQFMESAALSHEANYHTTIQCFARNDSDIVCTTKIRIIYFFKLYWQNNTGASTGSMRTNRASTLCLFNL